MKVYIVHWESSICGIFNHGIYVFSSKEKANKAMNEEYSHHKKIWLKTIKGKDKFHEVVEDSFIKIMVDNGSRIDDYKWRIEEIEMD